MATRYDSVHAWVNPSVWDDVAEAHRVIEQILVSGSDDEADWVRIAGGGDADQLAAAARTAETAAQLEATAEDLRAAEAASSDAREQLYTRIRAAVDGGMSQSEAHRLTGVSRVTIAKVVVGGA